MDKTKIEVDLLLSLREQLSLLLSDMEKAAAEPQFADIPDLTRGTMYGTNLAIQLVDARLALATGDSEALRKIIAELTEEE